MSENQNVHTADMCLSIPVYYRFAEKTVSKWMELLKNASFPYGPVNNIQQAFSDPQVSTNVKGTVGVRKTNFFIIKLCYLV